MQLTKGLLGDDLKNSLNGALEGILIRWVIFIKVKVKVFGL